MQVARLFQCATQHAWLRPRRAQVQDPFTCASAPKGFSSEPQQQDAPAPAPADAQVQNSAAQDDDELDIERRIRRGKNRRRIAVPQVKVVSEQVEALKDTSSPLTPESQAETAVVATMLVLFSAIIIEGLVLAGSGFMSDEADQWVMDVLYPSYTPTVVIFLAVSTLYGLGKTGLLPGQKQADN